MHRPLCGCRCGCRRRPGRLVLCVRCRARIGPGCCLARESRTRWGRGLCHVCHDGEPEHEVYSSVEVYEDEMVADGLDTLATGVLPPGGDAATTSARLVDGGVCASTGWQCARCGREHFRRHGVSWCDVCEDYYCQTTCTRFCGRCSTTVCRECPCRCDSDASARSETTLKLFYRFHEHEGRRFLWRCGYCSLVMCVPRQCASNHVRRCPPGTRFSSPHTCADHCPFSEARRLANMNDQLNGGIVACFEPAAREVQIQEQRYADRVIQDVDSERATPSGASTLGNRCILPQLGTYLSEQLDINNDAEKERRKARDERGLPRPPKKGAGQSA